MYPQVLYTITYIIFFSSESWEKNKRYAEQAAALVANICMGLTNQDQTNLQQTNHNQATPQRTNQTQPNGQPTNQLLIEPQINQTTAELCNANNKHFKSKHYNDFKENA